MARALVNKLSRDTKNYIINGAFDFWQRATSFVGGTSIEYTADRWHTNPSGGTNTVTRQSHTLDEIGNVDTPFYLRYQSTVANDNMGMYQRIEGVRTLAGKQATVIFWMRKTAGAGTTIRVEMNQSFGTGGSPSTEVTNSSNITVSSSWQQYAVTLSLASIAGKTIGTNLNDHLAIGFINPANETFTLDISQVMVIEGPATVRDFYRAGASLEEELSMCQRYYEQLLGNNFIPQMTFTTNTCEFWWPWIVTKRITSPTLSFFGTANNDYAVINQNNGGIQAGFSFAQANTSANGTQIVCTKAAHTLTQSTFRIVAALAFIAVSAEL